MGEELKRERIAAFFDFDKTLVEVESGKMGFQWLKDHQMLPLGFFLKVVIANAFYRVHLIPEELMVKVLLSFYRKKRLADFERIAEEFYQTYLQPHLAPQILARTQFHKKQKHLLVLISGSLRYYLEPVVKNLGFDHLLCTELEVGEDGLLTGRSRGPVCVGENKRQLILKLIRQVGVDMSESYAYGNHQADIPLLEMVGNPYAVEPTTPLRIVARQRSWPILTYR